MPSGKVKWFNAKKGYGFITEDETNKDIFLHVSALEASKLRVLKEDQKIVFDIKEEKDKPQAINIKIIPTKNNNEDTVGTFSWENVVQSLAWVMLVMITNQAVA